MLEPKTVLEAERQARIKLNALKLQDLMKTGLETTDEDSQPAVAELTKDELVMVNPSVNPGLNDIPGQAHPKQLDTHRLRGPHGGNCAGNGDGNSHGQDTAGPSNETCGLRPAAHSKRKAHASRVATEQPATVRLAAAADGTPGGMGVARKSRAKTSCKTNGMCGTKSCHSTGPAAEQQQHSQSAAPTAEICNGGRDIAQEAVVATDYSRNPHNPTRQSKRLKLQDRSANTKRSHAACLMN